MFAPKLTARRHLAEAFLADGPLALGGTGARDSRGRRLLFSEYTSAETRPGMQGGNA